MKKIFKIGLPITLLMAMLLSLTGCVEHQYYRQNHHHSRPYYERRHMPPPAGVEFDIHN